MNCAIHTDAAAVAYCRTCGVPVCEQCKRVEGGAVFCPAHASAKGASSAESPYASPYTAPYPGSRPQPVAPDASASPGVAFLLGLIPGVGAIYNGQYVKGLVHVIVLGVLISIVSSDSAGGFEPVFGMLIGVWVFYMAFEAYHTARRRQAGLALDEFSSLVPLHPQRRGLPVGPIVLIAIGALFLLNNLDIIHFSQIVRYWPIGLIGLGAYMLYERLSGGEPVPPPSSSELSREH
jgi:TM2 domain-containing membrane protein YozV